MSKSGKNITTTGIAILIISFLIYLLTTNTNKQAIQKKNNEIANIQKMNELNKVLNDKATQIPKEFKAIETSKKGIYSYVEQMPKYINCEYLLEEEGFLCTKRYISNYVQQLTFPKEERPTTTYKAYLRFVVNKKGFIRHIDILESTHPALDKFMKTHIKKMPKFAKVGYHKNKKVQVEFSLPITIKPSKD